MIYIYLSGRFFFVLFNDTPTTEIYTLSLHDALPIWPAVLPLGRRGSGNRRPPRRLGARGARRERARGVRAWQGRRGARADLGLRRGRRRGSRAPGRAAPRGSRAEHPGVRAELGG